MTHTSRGRLWLEALSGREAEPVLNTPSVLSARVALPPVASAALALAVVPDVCSRMPRATHGEMGLEQAWTLAARIRQCIADDEGSAERTPILAVVDTPGQAFGRVEEERCISAACAASVEAYAAARAAGHPLLTLIVGRAISGSFLAHGLQGDAILALGGEDIMMHAMSRQSIARVTRRTLAEVAQDAAVVLPMSYAIEDAHRLGIVDTVIPGISGTSVDAPRPEDVATVRGHLAAALAARTTMKQRYEAATANPHRLATAEVRRTLRMQWNHFTQ